MLEKYRNALMNKWNKQILCNMPPKGKIRQVKRSLRTAKHRLSDFCDEYIVEAMKQNAALKEYEKD